MENINNQNYERLLAIFTASLRRTSKISTEFTNYIMDRTPDVGIGYNIASRFLATLQETTQLSAELQELQLFYNYDEPPPLSYFLQIMPQLHFALRNFGQNIITIFRPEPVIEEQLIRPQLHHALINLEQNAVGFFRHEPLMIENFIDEPHRIYPGK